MKKFRLVLLGLVVAGLAACVPTFPEEATLTAVDSAPAVALGWPAATGFDEEWPVTGYAVAVNGTVVSIVDDWAEGCLLNGLDDETTYEIEVRAVDGRGAGSEPLVTEHTTGVLGADTGAGIECSTAPPPIG